MEKETEGSNSVEKEKKKPINNGDKGLDCLENMRKRRRRKDVENTDEENEESKNEDYFEVFNEDEHVDDVEISSLQPKPDNDSEKEQKIIEENLNVENEANNIQGDVQNVSDQNATNNNQSQATTTPVNISSQDSVFEEYSPDRRFARLSVVLGHGSQKLVYKAIDTFEAQEVAWNTIELDQCPQHFLDEINLLKSISHPNIIKLKDFWFSSKSFIFITELMTSGTLREYIKTVTPNIRIIKHWSKQILSAIEHLHSKSMIHRDIKCENIFVNGSTGEVKIGDLGIAKKCQQKRYTIVGTPEFMAREVFEGEGYGEGVDIYAFGMALLEMSTREYPYAECVTPHEIFKRVMTGVLPQGLCKVTDACLRHLIVNCIANESERYSLLDCLNHHFIANEDEVAIDSEINIPDQNPEQEQNTSRTNAENSNQPLTGCKQCLNFFETFSFANVMPPSKTSLTLISYKDNILNLQLYYKEKDRFIKFDFDIERDTLESITDEMVAEKVFKKDKIVWIKEILNEGIEVVKNMLKGKDDLNINMKKWINNELVVDSMLNCNENNINTASPLVDTINKQNDAENKIIEESVIQKSVSTNCNIENDKEENKGLENTETKNVLENSSVLSISTDKSCPNNTVIENSTTKTMPENNMPLTPIFNDFDFPVKTFPDEMPIEEFVKETAITVKRDNETAISWIKTLKTQELQKVGDLKILVDEDWDNLGLTVFSSRAMKNMLYGKDKHPLKEKDLSFNNYLTAEDDMTIDDFINTLSVLIERNCSEWIVKLLRQDVRNVGELKCLTVSDWERLELCVFGYRIIKNAVMRKGKITKKGKVI